MVVTHRSTTDIVHQPTAWADFTSIEVDTTGQPWRLAVDSPIGLRFAAWEVTLLAPDGWLSAPRPWRSAELDGSRLRWPRSVPAASRDGAMTASLDYRVVSAELRPDMRSTTTARATDHVCKPFTWGAYWLSTLIFCLVVRWHLRAPRGPAALFESVFARRARRAVRPLPYLVVIAGAQAVTDAVLPASAPAWPVIAWTADVILLVLLTSAVLLWWLPRTAVAALAATGSVALALTIPDRSAGRTWLTDAAAATAAFVISLLLVVGVSKALLVLLRRRTDTPRWLWWAGAASATVLVLEELLFRIVSRERQQWLDSPQLFRDTSQIYRYYPLGLLDEAAWLTLLIATAAVWRYWADHWFERGRRSPLCAAIVLFAVGPMWWDVQLWGIWWWAWLLGIAAVAVFWLLWPTLWPPVLDHPAIDTDDLRPEHLRHRARQWYADRPARGSAPSAVHVLIAAGPDSTPTTTARVAIRFAAHHVLVLAATVGVAQDPLPAGVRLRAQPVGDVHRQHQPSVRRPRDRHRAQRDTQPRDVDPTRESGVSAAMTTTMLAHQRQLRDRSHRPIGTQHRVGELEHRISRPGQTLVELTPELGQLPVDTPATGVRHTDHRSPLADLPTVARRNDRPRAAPMINRGRRPPLRG